MLSMYLQFLWRQTKCFLVVVYGQMGEAHLMQRSPKIVHALLTLSTQLYVPPQEGEPLKTKTYTVRTARRMNRNKETQRTCSTRA